MVIAIGHLLDENVNLFVHESGLQFEELGRDDAATWPLSRDRRENDKLGELSVCLDGPARAHAGSSAQQCDTTQWSAISDRPNLARCPLRATVCPPVIRN
nr:hypothetical protein [Mesorhizobium sp. LCM 4577]